MTDTDLDTRTGLPDALRALVREYPRAGWEADPGFNGLIAFWLERHMMFRRLLERMEQEMQAVLSGDMAPERYAAGLSRLGSLLLGELHGHHQIEDYYYFPKLATRDPRMASGFEILDRDHHALDGHLARFAEAANAVLAPGAPIRDRAGALHQVQTGLSHVIDRHLEDEEEIVVPIILKHGTEGLE